MGVMKPPENIDQMVSGFLTELDQLGVSLEGTRPQHAVAPEDRMPSPRHSSPAQAPIRNIDILLMKDLPRTADWNRTKEKSRISPSSAVIPIQVDRRRSLSSLLRSRVQRLMPVLKKLARR